MKQTLIVESGHTMKKRIMIGGLIVSLFAGCTVGPKYRRPEIKSPEVIPRGWRSDRGARSDFACRPQMV